tara:strand:+ start:170 stop:412 length:243 start_codon:yes stop_codon:yes gene_type:complete
LYTQTCQAAIAIKRYRADQTGAKIQSGGVRKDLFSEEYHGSLEDMVATLPINEAKYVAATKKIKDTNLFFTIKVLYIIIT